MLVLSCVQHAKADLPELRPQGHTIGPFGLSGGRYVGSAVPSEPSLRVASSLGYAYTEDVLTDRDHHQRVAAELYGAFIVHPALQVSLGSELRYDRHQTRTDGRDSGFLGATRLSTRHAFRVHPRLSLAAEPGVVFPGASSVGRGVRGSSLSLVGLATYEVSGTIQLGLLAGYRLDGTKRAVPAPLALSDSDRLAASLSAHDAYLVGASFAARFAPFSALIEWSWDIADHGVPSTQSPMRVRAAVQRSWGERFVPGIELGIDTSARPDFDQVVRIEPRLWARVGLQVLLDRQKPKRAAASTAVNRPPPPRTATLPLTIQVVDDADQPVEGARVVVRREAGNEEHVCDASGRVTVELPREGSEVSIALPGYEPYQGTLRPDNRDAYKVVLARALPSAEIRGAVRSLSGAALKARVEVLPLSLVVDTLEDGRFVITVAPGHYTLKISAEGHETQQRAVQAELRGVTILVVDLRRDRK